MVRRAALGDSRKPVTTPSDRPVRNGTAMTYHKAMTDRTRPVKGLVSWSVQERLRLLWYWLRLEFSDYNYAFRRSIELRLDLPASPQYRPSRRNRPAGRSECDRSQPGPRRAGSAQTADRADNEQQPEGAQHDSD